MNQNDVLKMLEAFNAMFALLPDKIVLDTVILYRKRDVPAIKQFFHRMFDDAKRKVHTD